MKFGNGASLYRKAVKHVMGQRARKETGMTEKERGVFKESAESRLRTAACRIVPDKTAVEHITEGVKAGKRSRRRLTPKIPAAVFAACLLFALLCFVRPELIGEDVVVYAATEEHGWQKLVEGERILLKKEPFQSLEKGEMYPYTCTFRLEVPENYLYDREFVVIRDDHVDEEGDFIVWRVAPDRPEDAGRIMQGIFRLWIVDENRERQAALELELTKEDGKCYAELKRVWESSGYQK